MPVAEPQVQPIDPEADTKAKSCGLQVTLNGAAGWKEGDNILFALSSEGEGKDEGAAETRRVLSVRIVPAAGGYNTVVELSAALPTEASSRPPAAAAPQASELAASVPITGPAAPSSPAGTIAELGFSRLDGVAAVDVVADAREVVTARLAELLEAVEDAGCDLTEQQYSFREICHRKRLRWDLRIPEDCAAWAALEAHVTRHGLPQLAALCDAGCAPRLLMSGAVVSRPGAQPQSFHADGTGRLANIFVPLVDIAPDDDGTQFWPRSHRDEAAPDRASTLAADATAMSAMVSPGCPAGGMLSFDYRVVHRGLANERRERAVAYFVVALAAGVEDSHNFPDVGVRDATPEHAAAMPFWDDEVGRVVSVQRTKRDGGFAKLAHARGCDVAEVKKLVRGFCSANGLDPSSLQAQESAARAMLRDAS